jgi:lipid II:glycine glycyltransferase (peptidoglycan interpeptide bridge formation enzyme)
LASAPPVTALALANPAANAAEWEAALAALPHGHLLQSWEWGAFKERYGWRARRLCWQTPAGPAAAQVLTRTALRGLKVLYVPKGPLLDWAAAPLRAQVLAALEALARRERAILIKIDPDVALSVGLPGAEQAQPVGQSLVAELAQRSWRCSPDQIQFRNTVLLDLRRDEAELLAAMKQKTRYNLRLAERKGVRVRPGSTADLDLLYQLYAETSLRDGFVIRSPGYYHDVWGSFMAAGLAQPFIAEVAAAGAAPEPVGALVVFRHGRTAWYMYGMSRAAHRDKMPNHLLQWHAIRWARDQGCATYDFWGAPDHFVESDPLWGVWKFKEGFGGQLVRHIGAWDYAPSPLLYRLYTAVLPRMLAVMRRRGRGVVSNDAGQP